jgi:lipoprotein-anchoring transpeptidase ErfK/SrfK
VFRLISVPYLRLALMIGATESCGLVIGAAEQGSGAGTSVVSGSTAAVKRKSGDWIRKQDPPIIFNEVERAAGTEKREMRAVVSIAAQRLWVMLGDQVYIDTPICSGKRLGMTPVGSFKVLEKDPDHRSNIYGSFVDAAGRVVRDGVSLRVDSAPSGTRYRGAPMRWFMRLTDGGIGMHVGVLPGYPASHGCVRLPEEIAALIYRHAKIGTPVEIVP